MHAILTKDLFPVLDQMLIELLRSLPEQDWNRQTLAPHWKVKDVAAHLLDGNLRALSMLRDGYKGDPPANINTYHDLVSYLNRLNADWVKAMRRLSPVLLIDWLEKSGSEYTAFLQTLDPFEQSAFSVAWAGEEASLNWFHIAREYTEKWHHQQQIRYAVGQETSLYRADLYFPYLDTSMRALPHHYREVYAQPGTLIRFVVTGEGGGEWQLLREELRWIMIDNRHTAAACVVEIKGKIAWRMFTKGISREDAASSIKISGKKALGVPVLSMLAVMA
jgi:uncharacterized protein (TIGR03083 family)